VYDFEIKEGKYLMACKSICSRFPSEKVTGFHNGQRYCATCMYYITTKDRACTCCHFILRSTRRNNKRRQGGAYNDKSKFDFEGDES
jgi:hypothetical protein